MRITLISIAFFSFLTSFGQTSKDSIRVTVILYDYENLFSEGKVDTLIREQGLDTSNTKFDIFFCHNYLQTPYYVPTSGIFKNSEKQNECDRKIYPQTVKCYEYDKLNRVIRMTVSGSGTENDFRYKYDNEGKIVEFSDYDAEYKLRYDKKGRILELKYWFVQTRPSKKFVFKYN